MLSNAVDSTPGERAEGFHRAVSRDLPPEPERTRPGTGRILNIPGSERVSMTDRVRSFVANDLWLLVGMVTLVLTSIAEIAGLGTVGEAVGVLGLFLFTPAFLFWGDEIAAILFDDRQDGRTDGSKTGARMEADRESGSEDGSDAVEELKRRYAEGGIDDVEFERRLDRLLSVDDALDGVFPDTEPTPSGGGSVGQKPRPEQSAEDGEQEQEQELER